MTALYDQPNAKHLLLASESPNMQSATALMTNAPRPPRLNENVRSESESWHDEVISYIRNRQQMARDAQLVVEVRYLESCLSALAICKSLGVPIAD